jgi:MFS family permease
VRIHHFIVRWRTALLAGLVFGVVFGLIEGFSIFSLAFADELHVARSAASGMFAAYLLVGTIFAPMAGLALDRFGPRRVILTAFPLFVLGIAACATTTALWQLYVFYIGLIATSTTFLITSAQVMVKNGYPNQRGKAVGIAYACLGAGDFALFSALGLLVQHVGWRTAYASAAVIAIVAGVVFGLLTRPARTRMTTTRGAPTSSTAETAKAVSPFGQPAFLFLLVAAFLASTVDFVVFQHVVPYLVTSGYSESAAGFVLGLTSLGYIAGQLGAGVLSDRTSREFVGSGAAALYVVAVSVLWLSVDHHWVVALVAVALGTSVGGIVGSGSAAVGDLFSGATLGRVSGVVQVGGTLGAAFGTWLGGFGFDMTASYLLTFAVAGACAVTWIAAIWSAAPRQIRSLVSADSRVGL